MSQRNHKMVDGRLLQMDKKFSSLKERQKARIAELFYEICRLCYIESGEIPGQYEEEKIVHYVLAKIEDAQIWIPDGEIYAYYHSRKNKMRKRLEKEFSNEQITE